MLQGEGVGSVPLRAVGRAPLLYLRRADLPQLVDLGGRAGDGALSNLGDPANGGAVVDGVRDGLGFDADDADAGIVLGAVVLAISKVAEPGLESGTVGLLDELAVRNDAGLARDRGPVARRVVEGDVGVRVAGDFVRLVRLCVCVEEEVDATRLLGGGLAWVYVIIGGEVCSQWRQWPWRGTRGRRSWRCAWSSCQT